MAAAVLNLRVGIWVAVAILVIAFVLFGSYYLWHRSRARRQSRKFEGAIEAQTAAAPRSISDPNKRAALDKLRQKFQTGLQVFKTKGKDIYRLPWYAIIGEPGSGKSEAIRHSGIDFPPGMQEELQGSGGTVNMDWWFTNRGIILDTAGSMIFNEARAGESPEWREFLRLLKKARPQCPINGLFLVLSVESLIKDSADTIAQKASKLAQQLDLIQRTLDVRFPVYLLVTKCDLLMGFREFFDNVTDPLLQHQIFGWSNPDPLDAQFRPDLVEEHLKTVAARVRRRRLALLRDGSTDGQYGDAMFSYLASSSASAGGGASRRADEVSGMFALPESLMRLAPRLRRYLETIFVAGEWSAKPVFLRGIYFTSSMREGKALDEAIAMATGVPLDELPEDRSWEKNRAFFLRDLFNEKVFRECGLVTRASNVLQLRRRDKILISVLASVALVTVLGFAIHSFFSLKDSVLSEAKHWQAGATNWVQGEWLPAIVRAGTNDPFQFSYGGNDLVAGAEKSTVIEFHGRLKEVAEKRLPVGLIFRPIAWVTAGPDLNRSEAQRAVFEAGVLRPLVRRTRDKIQAQDAVLPTTTAVVRHREALRSLMQLEADNLAAGPGQGFIPGTNAAARYVESFLSYLTETNAVANTKLTEIFAWTYSTNRKGWPSASLSGGNSLSNNAPIRKGLAMLREANATTQTNIQRELALLNRLADGLQEYHQSELRWLTNANPAAACNSLQAELRPLKTNIDKLLVDLQASPDFAGVGLTNLRGAYSLLESNAFSASDSFFKDLRAGVTNVPWTSGLFAEITKELKGFASKSTETVSAEYAARSESLQAIDRDQMALVNGEIAHRLRWELYTNACTLASAPVNVGDDDVGNEWRRFITLKISADQLRTNLTAYTGPLMSQVVRACNRIAGEAERKLQNSFVESYVKHVDGKLSALASQPVWDFPGVTNAHGWFVRIEKDLKAAEKLGPLKDMTDPLRLKMSAARQGVVKGYASSVSSELRKQLRFPVLLTAKDNQAMTAKELADFRVFLGESTSRLGDSIWGYFLGSDQTIKPLVTEISRYASVVNSLVDLTNKVAEFELFIFERDKLDPRDRDIVDFLRTVKLFDRQEELTRPKDPSLGRRPIDLGIELFFGGSAVAQEAAPNWWLIRLIRDKKATSPDNGRTWRIRIRFENLPGKLTGDVIFEARLNQPLPKEEDWPKQ